MMRQIGDPYGQPDRAELEYRIHRLEMRVAALAAVVRELTEHTAVSSAHRRVLAEMAPDMPPAGGGDEG
jgi:uncharacterized coiled-coil protein SlyX